MVALTPGVLNTNEVLTNKIEGRGRGKVGAILSSCHLKAPLSPAKRAELSGQRRLRPRRPDLSGMARFCIWRQF